MTDTWTISPNLVNEIRMGYTKQGNWFVPSTNGFDPTSIGLQYGKFNQFPNFNIGGSNCGGQPQSRVRMPFTSRTCTTRPMSLPW